MTKSIDFYFDFGSPNAYLCLRALPAIEARIAYQPIEFLPRFLVCRHSFSFTPARLRFS